MFDEDPIIESREPTYENGKIDGSAEVYEAVNEAYHEIIKNYEEKINFLEKKLKKLYKEFDLFPNKLD